MSEENEELETHVRSLKEQLDNLNKDLKHKQNEIEVFNREKDENVDTIAKLNKDNKSLQARLRSLNDEITKLDETRREDTKTISGLKLSIEEGLNNNRLMQDKITKLSIENKEQETRVISLNNKITKLEEIRREDTKTISELKGSMEKRIDSIFPKNIYNGVFSKDFSSLQSVDIEQIYTYLLLISRDEIEDSGFISRFIEFDQLIPKEDSKLCEKIINDLNKRLKKYKIYLPKVDEDFDYTLHESSSSGEKISKILSFGIYNMTKDKAQSKSRVECE